MPRYQLLTLQASFILTMMTVITASTFYETAFLRNITGKDQETDIRKNSPLREYQRCNKENCSTNKTKEN